MRAFMSDRLARAELINTYGPSSGITVYEHYMREADYEAQRILAETESAIAYPVSFNVGIPTMYRSTVLDALADALRGFVEGDCDA